MYKYNGEHRDPGPAKNSRSRREDAEVSSPKATAERPSTSYSHLILGNFDAPHAASFGYNARQLCSCCVMLMMLHG